MSLTAHCLVRNEENYILYSVKSVIDFVDKVMVFDTGSSDRTIEIVRGLVKDYPEKIIFEEKGPCDKKRHTELRQEMIDKTNTDWFMILDGDEVWTKRGMEEAISEIQKGVAECLVAPFFLCVGDIFHRHRHNGTIRILQRTGNLYPRFIKICRGVHWKGGYNQDSLYDVNNGIFFNEKNTIFLGHKYWHLTKLVRSRFDGDDYSSGGSRDKKRSSTYFLIGAKIKEDIPEVFESIKNTSRLSLIKSLINFFVWITKRLMKNFGVHPVKT